MLTVDKKSGVVKDGIHHSGETFGDPQHPFDLLCRVITVSLETMKIVRALPQMDI
jgi:predicted helicase